MRKSNRSCRTLLLHSTEFFQTLHERGIRLTEPQRAAVSHVRGPLAVYAGPGSGKTTVITVRAAYLWLVEHISTHDMVVFTFTRQSAHELRTRLHSIDPRLSTIRAGTFHSVYLRWMMKYAGISPRILSAREQVQMIRSVLGTLQLSTQEEQVQRFAQRISQLKNHMVAPGRLRLTQAKNQNVAEVYMRYEQERAAMEAWDYDDILLSFHQLLRVDGSFRTAVQQESRFIMIDEFQDSSLAQWLSIKTLCELSDNVFVVGDDDQSIYRFRGADPQVLQNFRTALPTAQEIVLRHNFRSTDAVISASARLIAHNTDRKEKTFEGVRGAGVSPRYLVMQDETQEASVVAKDIATRLQADPNCTIGVLARTNRQLMWITHALRTQRIAHGVEDERCTLFGDARVQHALDVLRATQDRHDLRLWQLAIRAWSRAHAVKSHVIASMRTERGRTNVDGVLRDLLQDARAKSDGRAQKVLRTLTHIWQRTEQSLPPKAIIAMLQTDFTGDAAGSRGSTREARQVLQLLQEDAAPYTSIPEYLRAVQETRKHAGQRAGKEGVQVLTFHGAKGLEFDDVYLLGIVDGIVPHARALADASDVHRPAVLQEERRLLYVGMTRARSHLSLTRTRTAGGEPAKPSPLLRELGLETEQKSANLPKMRVQMQSTTVPKTPHIPVPPVGSALKHSVFGDGVIKSVDIMFDGGHKIGILFCDGSLRYVYWEVAVHKSHVYLKEAGT